MSNSKINSSDFKSTLGRFATGVTVVTFLHNEQVRGITVNAFMSVSLKPPLVLVSIDKNASSHNLLKQSERYGVSILSEEQEALSNHFAGWTVAGLKPSFDYVAGMPLLKGAVAQLLCRIVGAHEAGDHTLFIGEVESLSWRDAKPLLYYASKYGRLEPKLQQQTTDG